jgi:hypothetical protein
MAGLLDALTGGNNPAGLLGLADALSPGRVVQRQEAMRRAIVNKQLMDSLGLERDRFEWEKKKLERPDVVWNEEEDGSGVKKKVPYEVVRLPNGSTTVRRMDIQGMPGGSPPPNNPYLSGSGAMNESQSKNAYYANRLAEAEGIFRGRSPAAATAFPGLTGGGYMQGGNRVAGPGAYSIENEGTSRWEKVKSDVGKYAGYNSNSPGYQKFDAAARNFLTGLLRPESGAVINYQTEYPEESRKYIPMPGDSPALIEQKRQARATALKGVAAGAGKGYRPEYVIDAQGNYARNPAGQAQPQAQSQPQASAAPRQISSKAEYDALPSGQNIKYIAPDGTVRFKR